MHSEGRVAAGGEVTDEAPVGWFRWNTVRDTWEWSEEMFRIHGYEPYSVRPSMQLVLDHKVGGHRSRAFSIMRRVASMPGPFSHHHQLLDRHGRLRVVLVVGDCRPDTEGELVAEGYAVDVTSIERAAADEAVRAATRNRAVINHAQGALMALHGLSETAAQSLLVWHSQQYNVKLSRLAESVVARFAAGGPVTSRSGLDRLLVEVAESLAHRRPDESRSQETRPEASRTA